MLKRTIGMGGFTLAEVLITLGIIGVVAAMTMPTLINSTQGAQYKTAKKALSVLSQAVVMNIALEDYDLSQVVEGRNGDEAAHGAQAAQGGGAGQAAETQTLYTLFKNRMNVVKVASTDDFDSNVNGDPDYYKIVDAGNEDDVPDPEHFGGNAPAMLAQGDLPENLTMLFFNDGITFIFDNTQENCAAATATTNDHYCIGYIDVNGQKAPNRVVECDGTGDQNSTLTGTGDEATCTVTNPTDIYPVMFYDQSIVPATAAGRAVLYAK